MRSLITVFVFTLAQLTVQAQEKPIAVNQQPLLKNPRLFANLGETFATPDAMAIDKDGRLFLSVPNFANYAAHGSKICVFNEKNEPVTWFDSLPKHPVTGRVHPMGIDFGPDGHLYIADAQSSPDGKEHFATAAHRCQGWKSTTRGSGGGRFLFCKRCEVEQRPNLYHGLLSLC